MYPCDFRPKKVFTNMKEIFIAMSFDNQYENVYTDLIIPSIKKLNTELKKEEQLSIYRAKDPKYTRSGWIDILEHLYTARIVLGVLSGDNANVFYELGIAHATQQIERQLLIAEKDYKPKFDLKDLIYTKYDPDNVSASVDELSDSIRDTLKLYDIKKDRIVSKAKKKLSYYEFDVMLEYGNRSHWAVILESTDLNTITGNAYLCHAELLYLATVKRKKGKIEFSYWWSDLGNAVLNLLGIIDDVEMNKRMQNVYLSC
jgi:hypothetical protein